MNTTLLTVAGYEREHFEADWEDVGGPEYGPNIVGHGEGDVFTLNDHEITIEGHEVVWAGNVPQLPEGWQ